MKWLVRHQPTTSPVTWEDMKKHDPSLTPDDKASVMMFVAQAVAYAESKLEMSLVERDMTAIFERGEELVLPRGPVIDGGIIAYSAADPIGSTDASQLETTPGVSGLYPGRLRYVGNKTILVLDNPCAVNWPLAVNYSAGFEDVAQIPADILGAIRIHAATLYGYREDIVPLSVSQIHRIDKFYEWRGRGSSVS